MPPEQQALREGLEGEVHIKMHNPLCAHTHTHTHTHTLRWRVRLLLMVALVALMAACLLVAPIRSMKASLSHMHCACEPQRAQHDTCTHLWMVL